MIWSPVILILIVCLSCSDVEVHGEIENTTPHSEKGFGWKTNEGSGIYFHLTKVPEVVFLVLLHVVHWVYPVDPPVYAFENILLTLMFFGVRIWEVAR